MAITTNSILDHIDLIVPEFQSKNSDKVSVDTIQKAEEVIDFFGLDYLHEALVLSMIIRDTIKLKDVDLNSIARHYGEELSNYKKYQTVLEKLEDEDYIVSSESGGRLKYKAHNRLIENLYNNTFEPKTYGYEDENDLIYHVDKIFIRKLKQNKADFDQTAQKLREFHNEHAKYFDGFQKVITPEMDNIKVMLIYSMIVANNNNVDRFDMQDELSKIFPSNVLQSIQSMLMSGNDELVKNKWVIAKKDMFGSSFAPTITLINTIFNQTNLESSFIPEFGEIIYPHNIKSEELLYPEGILKQINQFETLVKSTEQKKAATKLRRLGVSTGTSVVLIGHPGTGKTSYAYQLAKRFDRFLYVVDFTKIQTKYFGETEQNIAGLFEELKAWQKNLRKPGVILFNELDGLVAKRFEKTETSMSQTYNSITNTMLMEFENFKTGIIVATTNSKNLDLAFERRFTFKIHLPQVDSSNLVKIAKSKLLDLEKHGIYLDYNQFGKYPISPSQINNIRNKIAIEHVQNGTIDFSKLLPEIISQECTMQNLHSRTSIGYSQ
jgi:hypothetical protein